MLTKRQRNILEFSIFKIKQAALLIHNVAEETSNDIILNVYESIEDELAILLTELDERDKMKIKLTEKDREIIQEWYDRKDVESIDIFIKELDEKYEHDYGTICHAVAAAAMQAARKMNNESQGGITGFQANAVMWEFVRNWMRLDGPMKLVQYKNMLYPQYFSNFDTVINTDVWNYLQKEAKKLLEENLNKKYIGADVLQHWNKIASGQVPFNYIVQDEE